MNDFTRAIADVMGDKLFMADHPHGIAPVDILAEVQKRHPGSFTLCTVIDVADEKEDVYALLSS